MIKYILFLLVGHCMIAQTVTTFLDDPAVDIDDAMAFDTDGNLYGANFAGTTVYKVTPDGVATEFATGFNNPNGLAFDGDGNLFANNYSAQQIQKYDSAGTLLATYPIGGFPSGLTASFDGTAMIYTNVSNNSVNRLDADGTITVLFEGSPLNAPVGLAYDENGVLYIGNYVGREIYRMNNANTVDYVAQVPDTGAATNPFLGFITYAEDGYLYGTILGAHRIYKIDPTQTDEVSLFAGFSQGSDDGDIGTASFDTPNGIFYNAADQTLYISEFSGVGNVRKIEDFILGVEDVDNAFTFDVTPNPVNTSIHLRFDAGTANVMEYVRIYDVSGQLIKEVSVANALSTISVSEISSGTYFLEVRTTTGEMIRRRFLKQ